MDNPTANHAPRMRDGDTADYEALQDRVRQVEQRLQLMEKTLVAMELRFNALDGAGDIPDGGF